MSNNIIIKFFKSVEQEIIINPENAFSFFKEKWNELNFDQKKTSSTFLSKFLLERITIDADHPQTADNFEATQVVSLEIYNYVKDEIEGRPNLGHLNLGPGKGVNDISAVFKLLYDLKYIDNTLPELEQVIIRIFNLKDNHTVMSYFNDNGKLTSAAIEFKNAVNESILAN